MHSSGEEVASIEFVRFTGSGRTSCSKVAEDLVFKGGKGIRAHKLRRNSFTKVAEEFVCESSEEAR